jgi:two-component system alkaline phosphatase synthesis response regulator PhoP
MPNPILVVDDDPDILAVVAEILGDEGYPVLTASDGAAALAMVESQPLSLILVDRWMPRLDGGSFVRALRARGFALPVVAMTAASDPVDWAYEIGATATLAKPFKLTALLDMVEGLVG